MSIGDAYDSVKNTVSDAVDTASNAASDAVDTAESAASSAVDSAESTASSAVDSATNTIADGAKALGDGANEIESQVEGLASQAQDIASQAWDKFKYQTGIDKGVHAEKTGPTEGGNIVGKGDAATAQRELQANAPAERAALAKLPAGQRKEYEDVKAGMTRQKGDAAGEDVVAQRALQKMLIDGKLGQKDLRGGKTVLDNLEQIQKEPLAKGIDRGALLCETTREMADPSCINQENKNTCGAAAASMVLATKNPAEYARIVGQLASPEGKATLQNGDTLHRAPDFADNSDKGTAVRTTSQRLLEPALMNYGYSADGTTYNNKNDDRSLLGIETPGGMSTGLLDNEQEKVLGGVLGTKYEDNVCLPGGYGNDWNKIAAATRRGEPVPASISYGGGVMNTHHVVITGVDGNNVSIMNPQGMRQTFSKEEFQKMMLSYRTPAGRA
jgi:hypothetical protein